MVTVAELRASGTVLLDVVSGSHAYGLATATSDVDGKGVFCLSRAALFDLSRVEQISDERNNPNILELLATPPEQVLTRHPAMLRLSPKLFLS